VTTFVALGDSITLGMGDPLRDGTWRGWAAILAPALGAQLCNLAVSGALSADVEREQLPRALELRPDLAAVVVGVNDTLRHSFNPTRVGAALAHTVGALTAAGATVLTMRLPDPGRMFGLPPALARPMARRIRAVNTVTDAVAARFGTVHFDAVGHPATYDRRMWSVDRLHPSERGHRLVAYSYACLLGVPPAYRPDLEPSSLPPTRRAQLGWLATRGTRWVYDRSRDLVPYLIGMAVAEWWYELRDRADRLDATAARETTAALSALAGPVRLTPWPDLMDATPTS
jgi:lysophospholipase L1-like esterase